jgi:DNA-binding beta-propeller fold protein YncE
MKKILIAISFFSSTASFAQHSLEKLWQSDATLKLPESVLFDAKSNMLYVSNLGDRTPGSGTISKIDLNGTIIKNDWVTGLTSTKGSGIYKGLLYAAETNTVAAVDINAASVVQRISIEGAQLLNDITIDPSGIVYVSDTRTGKVHRIENGKASVYLKNLKNPNGLLMVGTDLYILSEGSLLKADANKKISILVEGMDSSTDGIAMVKENEFIIGCYKGMIYYVKADGSKQVLLDTKAGGTGAADIGYDAGNKIVYVPTLGKNMVVAYQLK